jgi:hypothetical protein
MHRDVDCINSVLDEFGEWLDFLRILKIGKHNPSEAEICFSSSGGFGKIFYSLQSLRAVVVNLGYANPG